MRRNRDRGLAAPERLASRPSWSSRAVAACVVVATALGVTGCPRTDDALILVGGERVDAAAIDNDPVSLLPGGIVMLGYLDAASLFATALGGEVGQLVSSLLPLGPESNFVVSRDVTRVYGGLYAMQGADYVAVIQGRFDGDAIRRAAETRTHTVSGVPLVKTRYGETDLYVAGPVGFALLTSKTALSGNETGMRRAIDRIRRGKLERSVPGWMVSLVETPAASFAVAGDFEAQPAVAAAAPHLPFLTGLKYVRVLGNFQSPGVNFAGAMTYTDVQAAATGAHALQNLEGIARVVSFFSSWGAGGAVPPLQVAQQQNEVAFTLPISDYLVRILLRAAVDTTRRSTWVQ